MLRLATGLAIIATIYVHSPVRPANGLGEQASAWADQARQQVVAATLRPSFARDLAEQTLRQQLAPRSADAAPEAPHTR